MPSPEDLEFQRTVTESGLMTEAQIRECLEAQTQAAGLGGAHQPSLGRFSGIGR